MARLVFGMNQSLDGYVDHMAFAPSPTLFRHFIEEAQGQAGSVYGRQMYEVMRYWDDDHPEWDAAEHAFAAAWRNQPKWVVSRSLKAVGPNARLIEDDLEGAIRGLKAERDGEIEVAGPDLAQSLTELGLIDEYRIYLHPVVLGHGKPYFAGPRPPLRLVANDRIGEDVIRLAYVPAQSRDSPDDTPCLLSSFRARAGGFKPRANPLRAERAREPRLLPQIATGKPPPPLPPPPSTITRSGSPLLRVAVPARGSRSVDATR